MNCEDRFEFSETEEGYELSNYSVYEGDKTVDFDIPSHYRGKPVVKIGAGAFESVWSVKSVHIPDTVVTIGDGAFYEAFNLEKVNIPPSVRAIGDSAFAECSELSVIEFSEGLETIGASAFGSCKGFLRSVTLPKSLKSLGDMAFRDCWSLESVTFLNPDVRFGNHVFFLCINLPPETQLMGLVCSCDITRPISKSEYPVFRPRKMSGLVNFRADPLLCSIKVFELAVKNKCFREADTEELFALLSAMIDGGLHDHLRLAEESGLLSNAAPLDKLIDYSAEVGRTEITARLLDRKNRKIGFNEENKYEL